MNENPVNENPVVPLESVDRDAAIGILCAGFADDAFLRWAAPEPHVRTVLGHRWAGLAVDMALDHGLALVTDDLVGVALWGAPGTPFWDDEGRAGLVAALTDALGPRAAELAAVAGLDNQRPVGPHWYLHKVAVHPGLQGQGIGVELLEPVLADADEAGVEVHLESSDPRNRSFYHRLGFATGVSFPLPGGADILTMTRPPDA